ncbi:MAG: phosphopantetheine-binding protein, partial [Acidobacteriota bacterium]
APASGGLYPRPAMSSEYVAPTTETEGRIAEIWESMLGVSGIGIHDAFLELGGDSLLASRLVARMRETFALDLPVRLFFEASTIAELARAVEAMQEEAEAEEVEDLEELTSYLEGLSEEEVEAELARRRAAQASGEAGSGDPATSQEA